MCEALDSVPTTARKFFFESLVKFIGEQKVKGFLLGRQKSESKSRELLQGTGDPEIGSLLTSFGISLSNILSLSSPRWCGVYSPY
jgi:hypothetical protein